MSAIAAFVAGAAVTICVEVLLVLWLVIYLRRIDIALNDTPRDR